MVFVHLTPHVARAVRGGRRQEDMARAVGISRRQVQRIELGTADEGRLELYLNAYIGAAVREGNLRHVAYLMDAVGVGVRSQPFGVREGKTHKIVPQWARAGAVASW